MSQPRPCQCGPLREAERAKAAGDVSIFAAVIILAVILIIAATTTAVIRYLHVVIDDAGRAAPPASYAAWLGARRPARGGPA